MTDGMTWTQPRSLTFFERIRLTWTLFWIRLPLPVDWLRAVWSSGATASFNLTVPKSASLHIVSGNGKREISVTVSARRVTTL
jgi:hypothetical protein